jgi:hypothetical protein
MKFLYRIDIREPPGGKPAREGQRRQDARRGTQRQGRPQDAAAIIGRPFAIEGVVQKGRQLGRQLGFPTANVPLGDYVAPRFGVYATLTRLADGRELAGVANIGVNPTTGEVAPRAGSLTVRLQPGHLWRDHRDRPDRLPPPGRKVRQRRGDGRADRPGRTRREADPGGAG